MRSGVTQVLLFSVLFCFFGSAYFFVASYPLGGISFLLVSFPLVFILIGLNVPLAVKKLQRLVYKLEEYTKEKEPPEESVNWNTIGPNWRGHPNENQSQSQSQQSKFYDSTATTKTTQQRSREESASRTKTPPVQKESPKQKLARERLDLKKDFTQQELEEVYRERVKTTHPDTESGSTDKFKQLKEDYDVLKK